MLKPAADSLTYIFKTFSLSYLAEFRDVAANIGALGITFASACAIVAIPVAGRLCDRVGAQRVILFGAAGTAVLAFPFFWLLNTENPLYIWAGLILGSGIAIPVILAASGSFLAQQFPTEVRASGLGAGREVGGAFAGGLAPLAALTIVTMSSTNATWGVSLIFILVVLCYLGVCRLEFSRLSREYAGMDTAALARVGEQLDTFAGEVFSSLARKDQRATAGVYVRGLMLDGRRKSMQPMAQRLQVDHQRLQQFVTTSKWDVAPVRKRLSRRACDLVAPDAWVIDDTGFTKDGDRSPGVARQYSGTLGKVGNCQIAVSVHAASDAASAPLGWRLFLPESWDDRSTTDPDAIAAITARRKRSAIPDTEHHRTKWEMAIEMIDELIEWGRIPPAAVADAGYGDATAFRLALTERGIDYVVAVKGATSAYPGDAVPEAPPYSGRGRPPAPRYPGPTASCRDLVLAAGRKALRTVTWRRGSKADPANPTAAMRSRFAALRVRPANRDIPRAEDGALPEVWLLAEWPAGADEPTDYWLSTLPADTPLPELVRLAKIRWRIEHDYRELKTGLGLDHFEGRSWLGWHHHATLVTAAHLFITTLRLADPKAAGQD